MAAPLQQTKLFIPPARAGLVARPRLLERLDGVRAEGGRAALICAPAGSGKTTLAGQWLSRLEWPSGWLALDGRDNALPRFFAYLIAALQAAAPGVGGEASALLDLPGMNPEEVITLLANDLAKTSGPLVLVLDDVHTLTNPSLHQALDLLLDALPAQVRLVLLTREDPAVGLARRRARGQLVELRQADLRFTLDEALTFLNESMQLSLSVAQAQELEARTEGWIAGLQLAALALQGALATPGAGQVERFLADFSGNHRFILDYLVEEVLARQTPEVHAFLLETSILERMCAGLCAAVTGQSSAEAQQRLEQAARANLFVIPLDEERRWFRYHHLFRDLLLARLPAQGAARRADLERRASDWFEANGDPRLAVEYALKAGDPRRAADLIERHIAARWQMVDIDFHLLLQRLPHAVVVERATLCLQSAWLGVLLGQPDRVLPMVQAAERCLEACGRTPEPGDPANRAFARVLRLYLADGQNQSVSLDESLGLALSAVPESNPGMRNSVAVMLGAMHAMEADFEAAIRYFETALELDRRVSGTNAVPIATMRLAFVWLTQGRLRQAERRLREAEAYVCERGSRRFYISGALNLLWGEVLLEWNCLDQAEAQIREGLRLLDDWPSPSVRSLGLSLLARLRVARGDLAGARVTLDTVTAMQTQAHQPPYVLDAIGRAQVTIFSVEPDRPALEAWVSANEGQARLAPCFRYEARQLALCRAWLALGRSYEAAQLLERLAAAARNRAGSRLTLLIWLAAARHTVPALALPALEEALRLAEPEGYVRTFLEAGAPVRGLLGAWLSDRHTSAPPELRAYAQQLLFAFGESAPVPPAALWPEPLSPREQEVLRLMAEGLTNPQIAARLVISVRTVKKHVENIHGKLGAQNRTQAVARARELGRLS